MEKELTIQQYEKIIPIASITDEDGRKYFYHVPTQFTLWRAQTLFSKEPETIKWINAFNAQDIFLDVGANVGMYTIYAAVRHNLKVYAFEPEAQNYALLNRNIEVNGQNQNVRAYCVGLLDKFEFTELYLSRISLGGAGHSLSESVNFKLEPSKPGYVQGSVSTTIDWLIQNQVIPIPTKIKIDVDGFERKIIEGAKIALTEKKLTSVLVEIYDQLDEHLEIIDIMRQYGFYFDECQVEQARIKDGWNRGMGNIIFNRQF